MGKNVVRSAFSKNLESGLLCKTSWELTIQGQQTAIVAITILERT